MISEKRFAVAYTSFWNVAAPLADRYVRLQNVQLERFTSPMGPGVPSNARGVTNELGFRIFCACYTEGLSASSLDFARVSALANETTEFIVRFREFSRQEIAAPDEAAIEEARVIAGRLLLYFNRLEPTTPLQLCPDFPGVGILDTCAGDVLAGNTLYEIKAADRSFRVIDIRQVLTYCALNYAAGVHRISRVALLNPRTGTYFSRPIEQVASEVSGTTAAELFAEILEFLEREYDAPGSEWLG